MRDLPGATASQADLMLAAMGPAAGSPGWYASGTSQVPRATPQLMWNWDRSGWNLMLHGVAFLTHTNQSGPRGRDKLYAANWIMAMASHRLGPGTLTLRSMLTLEPLTITGQRYPLLFQTGETVRGIPIVNGQHPHDFVMELAAAYQVKLGERTAMSLYGGPRGDPALGPPAFPHRLSASENPMAVISHHHQDSTHISSNVVTAGVTHGPLTWEVSGFHGREPDERRWGMEGGGIDSLSTRLTINPTPRWSGQVSVGRINNRETTHPIRDTLRTTASLLYSRKIRRGHWASALIWGRNHDLAFTQLPSLNPVFRWRTRARGSRFCVLHLARNTSFPSRRASPGRSSIRSSRKPRCASAAATGFGEERRIRTKTRCCCSRKLRFCCLWRSSVSHGCNCSRRAIAANCVPRPVG